MKKLTDLEKDHEATLAQLDEMKAAAEKNGEVESELRSKLEEVEVELRELKPTLDATRAKVEKLEEVEAELKELKPALNTAREEVKRLCAQVDEKDKVVSEQRVTIDGHLQKISELEGDLNESKELLKDLNTKNSEMDRLITEKKGLVEKYIEESSGLKSELTIVNNDLEALRNKATEADKLIQDQKAETEKSIKQREKEAVELKANIARLQEAAGLQKSHLSERVEELEKALKENIEQSKVIGGLGILAGVAIFAIRFLSRGGSAEN